MAESSESALCSVNGEEEYERDAAPNQAEPFSQPLSAEDLSLCLVFKC